ncbi:MAG: hypothetical protein KDA24_12365 [Deltaproteobacteria bacterium]|nr:hypothetical protein [Deltaproteobacteria bacterium]
MHRRASPRLLSLALVATLVGCSSPPKTSDPAASVPSPGNAAAEKEQALPAPPGAAQPPPADAPQYTLGAVLRGKAVYGDGLAPLAGARVQEYGGRGQPVLTGPDGRFELRLTNEATPAVLVTKEEYVPSLQIATESSRPYFGGDFKVEVFEAAAERRIDTEEYGTPQDPALGRVVLNFQPYGSSAGVRGLVQLEGATGFHYGADDLPIAGDRLPSPDPFAGEIVFRNLPVGEADVLIESPAGTVCEGPRQIPVPAGVSMRVYYFCQSPEKTAETAEFIESWRARGGPPTE